MLSKTELGLRKTTLYFFWIFAMREFYFLLAVLVLGSWIWVFFLIADKNTKKIKWDTINWWGLKFGNNQGSKLRDVIILQKDVLLLKDRMEEVIIWQRELIIVLLLWLFGEQHVFIQSLPWLAKTTAVKRLAELLWLKFGRIQWTPDLLPSDVIGFMTSDDQVKLGPIANNIVLFDEINRATPKLQSALMQSMEEQFLTIWMQKIELPSPFVVFATANPQGSRGVYQLPEAQIDRFALHMQLGYPENEELIIAQRLEKWNTSGSMVLEPLHLDFEAYTQDISGIIIEDDVILYVRNCLTKTRNNPNILVGCSPRAGKDLLQSSRTLAWMQWKDAVEKQDIDALLDISLGHRVVWKTGHWWDSLFWT